MVTKHQKSMPKLRVAHIASEVEPFSKTGGLASVLGALPRAQVELGVDAIIVTPYYDHLIDTSEYALDPLEEASEQIEIEPGVFEEVAYRRGVLGEENIPVYFVESRKFFGSREKLYGAKNDNARFLFFNIAALFLLKKIDFRPSIVHCHDWHAGLIPYLLKTRHRKDPFWNGTATLFTIHNLSFQLGHDWHKIPSGESDDGRSKLPSFSDRRRMEKVNFAKRAIIHADAINTVSETYREEILTEAFGEALHRLLKRKQRVVFGIVNGIDYDDFNPMTDEGLACHYNSKSVRLKKYNKKALQKRYGLTVDLNVPLLCTTSRITEQKGFKLVLQIVRIVLRQGTQIIVMGDGDEQTIQSLKALQREFPKQFAYTPFDPESETLLYAGSEIFLMPSRFEPCGINQMIALRYGCIPVVRHIGGLADTIQDYDPRTKTGNGFTFKRYNSTHLLIAIIRALENFKHARSWKELSISGLKAANSWELPAQKYINLYVSTLRLKKKPL
ncbi:MAG: glycogen/starch synthase [Candidatus Moranbacteria bacterium]|nr:glycogen/starch synthase [Candidatus Moranbacteria bacterium]